MVETLTEHGMEYIVIRDENGDISQLKHYNNKHKIWITLEFSKEKNNIDDIIIDHLSDVFLSQFK